MDEAGAAGASAETAPTARTPARLVALVAFVAGLVLLPPLSDGDLSVFDGITYAHHIEQVRSLGDDRAGIVTYPNHLLHHLLAYALVQPLRAFGVEHPGFVAGRLLSAGGAAALVLLVARAAAGRAWLGAAFALLLLSVRGVLFDAATGETVLPAAAAVLAALLLACRRPVPSGRLLAVLVLALLFRQDSVFAVPGVALAAALGASPGRRVATCVLLPLLVALLVLPVYLGAHALAPGDTSFVEWLRGIGDRSWSVLEDPTFPRDGVAGPQEVRLAGAARLHVGSLAWALEGRHGGFDELQLGTTLLFVGGLLAAAVLARGAGGRGLSRTRVLGGAIALTLLLRTPLFLWFEPEHWEWQVAPLALLVALAARATAGAPRTPRAARAAAGALLLALAALLLARHGPSTLRLRDDRMLRASLFALERGGPGAEVLTLGLRANMLFFLRGLPYRSLDDGHPNLPLPPDPARLLAAARSHGLGSARPVVLVVDRFVRDGMPSTLAALSLFDELLPPLAGPRVEVLALDGRPYGLLVTPAPAPPGPGDVR